MGKMTELEYNGTPFEVYEVMPEGDIKGGLIVIEEVWGLTDHIKDIADRFAAEGYYVVSPELLGETHIKEHADTLMLDLFNPEKRNEAQPKLRALMSPMQERWPWPSLVLKQPCHFMAMPTSKIPRH